MRRSTNRRGGGRAGVATHPGLAAALAMLLAASAAAFAADADGSGRPSTADRVAAELRAARAARSRLLAERQQWQAEQARLELLRETVRREARRLEAAADNAARREAELRKRLARRQKRLDRLQALRQAVGGVCDRLAGALDKLAAQSLPGWIPPATAAAAADAAQRLTAASERLTEAERRAGTAGVEVVAGRLGGRTLAVRLLRAGGAAAWWVSLDGRQAGTASMAGGQLTLQPAATAEDAEAIRKAFAVAESRAAPDWTLLPVPAGKPKGGAE